jgi:hypothetical protein
MALALKKLRVFSAVLALNNKDAVIALKHHFLPTPQPQPIQHTFIKPLTMNVQD